MTLVTITAEAFMAKLLFWLARSLGANPTTIIDLSQNKKTDPFSSCVVGARFPGCASVDDAEVGMGAFADDRGGLA
jgi:hypothetical protein